MKTSCHARVVQQVMELSIEELRSERAAPGLPDVHFPQRYVRAVVEEFSAPGDVVLDPFAGYGTTLVVCEALDRAAIGIELIPERVALTRSRLRATGRVIEGDARNLAQFSLGPIDLW
jgi:tRNA G10  N-methylase Trm11